MGVAVGIDLGTTNTVVACVRDGRVHVLSDDHGHRLLPSVVSFHPNGTVLVGHAAKARRIVDAKNTVASTKRLMGRPWDSNEMRLAAARASFELREGPGQSALVAVRGQTYTLPEISALVLKRARQIAEAQLGETVDKAVITVPAHFNELQRASTKVAGRVAGLDVLRILNEPTAAALAYGFGSAPSERIAVYDFGGGTFDCSLLELSANLYEVLATAGDTFLGGEDIDTAIAEQMCSAFLTQHRYDPHTDSQAFERLRTAAEQLKIELSAKLEATVELRDLGYGVGGSPIGLTFAMTQDALGHLADGFVQRTLQVTQDALNVAQLSPTAFDHVILVGGSTRMPLVRQRVEAFFGAPPLDSVNPDEVVAMGAAIQAAALSEGARRTIPPAPLPGRPVSLRRSTPVPMTPSRPRAPRAPVLVDVTPRALVVEVVGGFSDTVIARNATIPCEHTRVFATGSDQQTTVHIRVAQGEAERFVENMVLGQIELSGLRPAPRGEVTLSVSFELDADGTLRVQAVDASTGRQAGAAMRLVAVAQTEEEIVRMTERSQAASVGGG